jgi:hypothetical protein
LRPLADGLPPARWTSFGRSPALRLVRCAAADTADSGGATKGAKGKAKKSKGGENTAGSGRA